MNFKNHVSVAFQNFDHYISKFQYIENDKFVTCRNYIKNNLELDILDITANTTYDRKIRIPYDTDVDIIVRIDNNKIAETVSDESDEYLNTIWSKIKETDNLAEKENRSIKFLHSGISINLGVAFGKLDKKHHIFSFKDNIWEESYPIKNKAELIKLDRLNNQKVTQMIRFFRYWNSRDKYCKFDSYHLEVIIMEIFRKKKS